MMSLHKDKEAFKDIIESTSAWSSYAQSLIEKDYYATLILKSLISEDFGLVFKGGTSLSKAFHIINRFSEDIDLTYLNKSELNRKRRKELKYKLVDIVEKNGLTITNLENTRSKRDYNQYCISYDNVFPFSSSIKTEVIVELAFQEEAYPIDVMPVGSIIGDYLKDNGFDEIIDKYNLKEFNITVQTLMRTFIDKLFAICDYYLSNRTNNHSRHIYDLHRISSTIKYDNDFMGLFLLVKNERKESKICYSANTDQKLSSIIEEIINKNIFEKDYKKVTANLISDETTYTEAITSLINIKNNLIKIGL